MYVQIFLRLNMIVLLLLLIRTAIGNRLRKKFVYGLWIIVPVFLLSFPFVRVPQLFHWNISLGQIMQTEEKEDPAREEAETPLLMETDTQVAEGTPDNFPLEVSAEAKQPEVKHPEEMQENLYVPQTQVQPAGDVQTPDKGVNLLLVVKVL